MLYFIVKIDYHKERECQFQVRAVEMAIHREFAERV